MNLDNLSNERFLKSLEMSGDFVKYEIGVIGKEEYYNRNVEKYPDIYIPGILLSISNGNKMEGLSERTVVLNYDPNGKIVLGTIPQWYDEERNKAKFLNFDNVIRKITLKDYIEACYTNAAAERITAPYSPKTYFEVITSEAIRIGASEITIFSKKNYSAVTSLINLQVHEHALKVEHSVMDDLVKFITGSSQTYVVGDGFKDIPTGIKINSMFRGRVQIDTTYYGHLITIRLFDQRESTRTLDNLNYVDDTPDVFRKMLQNKHSGLKIFAGPTMSGKSTAINAALSEYLDKKVLKCVSIEQPVEQVNNKMIQIDCKSVEEYSRAMKSLIRHNPDIVYATELNHWTSMDILETANTGKTVFTTIHANSPADVLTRIQDLSGLSLRRIAMLIDTIVFQRLVYGLDGKLYPVCSWLHLDGPAKNRINQLKDDSEIFVFLMSKTSNIIQYVNRLIELGKISEETRNEVI